MPSGGDQTFSNHCKLQTNVTSMKQDVCFHGFHRFASTDLVFVFLCSTRRTVPAAPAPITLTCLISLGTPEADSRHQQAQQHPIEIPVNHEHRLAHRFISFIILKVLISSDTIKELQYALDRH